MFKLLLVVFAVVAIGIDARPYEEEFVCDGKEDGYYPDISDRSIFFSCVEGSLLAKVVCEDGFKFNGVDSCVSVSPVEMVEESREEAADDFDFGGQILPKPDPNPPQQVGNKLKEVFNIEITENIFPRSILIIGKMNREQKNG